MFADSKFRRLRAALGNALVWGAGWSGFALVVFYTLRLTGILNGTHWLDGIVLGAKFGILGAFCGAAFSSFMRLVYKGQRLSEISWWRFGITGGVATGLAVPAFLQTMNFLSGDGPVPIGLVLDDALITAVFGGAAAAGSLKLAQLADVLLRRKGQDVIDSSETVEHLTAAWEREIQAIQHSHSAQR